MKTWINTEASVQYLVGEKDDKAKVKINYRKWRKITVRQEGVKNHVEGEMKWERERMMLDHLITQYRNVEGLKEDQQIDNNPINKNWTKVNKEWNTI